jgi:SAM-dependent methyltransferase
MRYYDARERRLVYIQQPATPDHWDRVWEKTDFDSLAKAAYGFDWVVRATRAYLLKESRILEGGCGQGITVYALQQAGFEVWGVDTAEQTVLRIKKAVPDLRVELGDVEQLRFADEFFDGYWSLGVIEHRYGGYEKMLSEMARVIRPGGYLFLTVPALSWLRRVKAVLHLYPTFDDQKVSVNNFYQFALSPEKLVADLKRHGFVIVTKHFRDGFKGLRDEVPTLRSVWQWLKQNQSFGARLLRAAVDSFAAPWAGHILFVTARRQENRQ